jgi:hypothetical protein
MQSNLSKNTLKNRRRRDQKKSRKIATNSNPIVMINKERGLFPQRVRTVLHYQNFTVLNAATVGNPWEYYILNMTNAFLLDPTRGSNPTPGYAEFADRYRKYRVRKSWLTTSFFCAEGFAVNAFSCPSNFLPVVTVNPAIYVGNPRCKQALISAKGGIDQCVFIDEAAVTDYGGSASTQVEDAYVGNTDGSASPSDNVYWAFGVQTLGAASVTGVNVIYRLAFEVEFFELQQPAT